MSRMPRQSRDSGAEGHGPVRDLIGRGRHRRKDYPTPADSLTPAARTKIARPKPHSTPASPPPADAKRVFPAKNLALALHGGDHNARKGHPRAVQGAFSAPASATMHALEAIAAPVSASLHCNSCSQRTLGSPLCSARRRSQRLGSARYGVSGCLQRLGSPPYVVRASCNCCEHLRATAWATCGRRMLDRDWPGPRMRREAA